MTSDNYFSAFGFEPSFDINLRDLSKAYRDKQKVSHPDRFAHEQTHIQRQAVQNTALNNEMYQTLKSGVKRGNYILGLNGIAFDLETYTVDDVDMLINQLKYREQLADIKGNKSIDGLSVLQEQVTLKQTAILQTLTDLFNDDIESNESAIKSSLCELQFYDKLAYECELVEEHLMLD